MSARRGPLGMIMWLVLLRAVTPAAASPACADATACAAQCRDGAGELAACTAYADQLRLGLGVEPDRPRALALLIKACGTNAPDDAAVDAIGDPLACVLLGDLRRDGWLFEVEPTSDYLGAYLRATKLATCTDGAPAGCLAAARAELALAQQPTGSGAPPMTYRARRGIDAATRGCSVGRDPAACQLLLDPRGPAAATPAEDAARRDGAAAGLLAACERDSDVDACDWVVSRGADARARAAATAVIERRCTQGDREACARVHYRAILTNLGHAATVKPHVEALAASCDGDGHSLCATMATELLEGRNHFGLTLDPAAGVAIAERRCALGDRYGCQVATWARGAKGPEAVRDAAKARTLGERTCRVTLPDQTCGVCKDAPTLPDCVQRAIYDDHRKCDADAAGACERVGRRFRDGDGVGRDLPRAARYLRHGCDAADKGACAVLDDVCRDNPELPLELCQQALIQSDLFFEAEYQAAAGGDVDLVTPGATAPAATPGAITVADVAASVPTSYRRGKLDADLVVNIVLDRARQAAIKLVVSELLTAERRARYRYLRDLLEQGAALMADPSTLRREKFQDLGLTVVRAFVAANLVDGLYPSADALRAAPEVGATVTAGGDALATPGQPLSAEMHGYLVDVAYYWLGQTRLLGRVSATAAEPPMCPWAADAGRTLCVRLADRATAERAIGVAKVLDAIRLAKLLRTSGFEDLRRLIEAAGRSRTIANLETTPGLSLRTWQQQFVAGTRTRLAAVRAGITDAQLLLRASVYADKGLDLATLAAHAAGARAALFSQSTALAIGTDNAAQLMRLVRIIDRAAISRPAGPAPAPAADGAPGSALDVDVLALAKLRKDALEALSGWGMRGVTEASTKLAQIDGSLDAMAPALDKLDASIAELRALFARFPDATGRVSLDVGGLPLYAAIDLSRELRGVAGALAAVDDGLRVVFPGEVPARLRFARATTARLLGFLDLMQRVARGSPLSQRIDDVIGALRTLGTSRIDLFDAPLYDVLEPVLDAIKIHEPMSVELLFAVIGHVRLDTLITSLQGRRNACTDDTAVDCWVTKLIHALQESIERDGQQLRVDGGKFAQRLAQHGDDFRRKHTWRGYFHLTVGVGGLYSDPAYDLGAARRSVPFISEQVGVGLASPSVWGDRLTFKVGAAASGVLYRALLDSQESSAIMLHPVLLAVDLGDLIEAYVSPAMVLLYPPDDDHAAAIRWGFSAGLSVPLSAYLERL